MINIKYLINLHWIKKKGKIKNKNRERQEKIKYKKSCNNK